MKGIFLLYVAVLLQITKTVTEPVGECEKINGVYATLLPHATDCTKFYYCDWGALYEFDCPAKLHFNPKLKVCDWPEQAGCDFNWSGGDSGETPGGGGSGEGSHETPGGGDGDGSNETPDGRCPAKDGEFVTLLPHESDCTKFYKCDRGVAVEKDCPAGLHFNPTLKVCDYPEDAGCNGTGEPGEPEEPSEETPGGGSGEGEGSNETPDGRCPAKDGEFVTLLPHESDCTKFYKCDRGVAVEKDCPAGLHFNPTLKVCDYPEDAGCNGGGEPGEPEEPSEETPGGGEGEGSNETPDGRCPAEDGEFVTLFPHESDCTKFYKCDRGVAVEKDCPAGLHFNPKLKVCDYPEDAGCNGNGEPGEPEEPSEETPGGGEGEGSNETPDGRCPAEDGEFVTLFPHESDCTKFYKCDRGVAVEKDCPAGLHFNPKLKVCDYPEDAGCNGNGEPGEPEEPSEETPGGGEGEGSNETPDGRCPAEDGEFVTLFPHESDCTKFYKCDRGVAVEKDCPAGLHFNPKLKVCDYPEDAGCNGNGEPGEPEEPSEETPGGGEGEGSNETPDGRCPAEDGEFVTLFPHESDCTKFYKCDRGVAVEKDCPAGLHFNPKLKVCDYPEDAGCNGNGEPGEPEEPSEETPGGGEGEGSNETPDGRCPAEDGEFVTLFPHESDCTKFYKCDRGVAVEKDCPAGLHFNPKLKVCDYPEDAGCNGGGEPGEPEEPSEETPGGGEGEGSNETPDGRCPAEDGEFVTLFPHESDCTKFYKCDRGVAVEKDCPAGLHFNPTLKVCDYPEDAGCNGNGQPGEPEGPPGGGSGEGEGSNETPDGRCPAEDGEFVTLFPHESDCTKFYKCDRGVAVEKDCPAGLHFNPTLKVCDYPEDAGCNGNGQPGEPEGPPGGGSGEGEGSNETPDGRCPAEDGEFVTLFPHESDCTKFYKCDRGVAVEKDCPAGLHFNPTLKVCDYPEDAGCNGNGQPGEPEGPPGGGSGEGEGSNETPDGRCPAEDGEFVTLFPHESDCTKFYKCDRGVAVEKDCPAGLHFNPTLKVCDYPEDAGCNGNGQPGEPEGPPGGGSGEGEGSNETPDGRCPAEDGEFVTLFPHESDCTKFYKCDRGVAVEKDCPAGLHFNPTLKVCDYPEDAGCNGNGQPGEPEGPPGGGSGEGEGSNETPDGRCPAEDGEFVTLFPHESDCTKFYKCDRGVAVEKDCPAGLHFNPTLKVCDYPEDAGCNGNGQPGEPEEPSEETPDGGSEEHTEAPPSEEDPEEPEDSGESDGWCVSELCPKQNEKYVTFIAHKTDCTRFCKCDWGRAFEYVCPAGLHFNTHLNVCDYVEDAGCKK